MSAEVRLSSYKCFIILIINQARWNRMGAIPQERDWKAELP